MKTSSLGRRLRRTLALAGATAVVLAGLVLPVQARQPYRGKEPEAATAQYVLPNIIAALMSVAILAIPCKRFRRT